MKQLKFRQQVRIILTIMVCIVCSVLSEMAVFAGDEESDRIYYTALGDSISNGYYGDEEPEVSGYPVLIKEDLQKISGKEVSLAQFSKNGLTTVKLNAVVLAEPEVQEEIAQADLITLTIGANDLLNEFKKVSREILQNETRFSTADEALAALQQGIEENPLLLVSVASAIGAWDYDSFEEQWILAMENISRYRAEDAQMTVTTIYNPMSGRELPGTLNAVVESVISKMNEIIWNHAEEYDYQVVDLLGTEIGECTQSDGLHPNQTGQNLIRELTEHELNLDVFQNGESDVEVEARKELEEAAAKKAQEAAQRRQQAQRKKQTIQAGAACGILLVFTGLLLLIRKKRKQKRRLRQLEA